MGIIEDLEEIDRILREAEKEDEPVENHDIEEPKRFPSPGDED